MFLSFSIFSQKMKELSYPKNYFMFPIRPGLTNHLSGALGDLRTNHFHGGLDIKTEQREGLPVYAAAGGYVSELRVTTAGYGNVILIKHPNGLTTVYGHLKSFNSQLHQYITQKRYENETFEIALKLEPNQMPIQKGEIIGLSGNTGGSGGPHLHFEIRNENNNLLNPLYFGFSEITDNLPPLVYGLNAKPKSIDSQVNNAFENAFFTPIKKGNIYTLNSPIKAIGQIGLAIMANDKMNFNNNSYGISCMEVLVNGKENFYYHLEKIPVEDSKDINLHMDFAIEKTFGKKYHQLFLAEGNDQLPIYKAAENRGVLNIEEGKTYKIQINLFDSFENKSSLIFEIIGEKGTPDPENYQFKANLSSALTYKIVENTLLIEAKNIENPTSSCQLGVNGKIVEIAPAYIKNNSVVYLYDLRKGLPQFAEIDDLQIDLPFVKAISPTKNTHFIHENLSFFFDSGTVYDTLYLTAKKQNNYWNIGQNTIPLRNPYLVNVSNFIGTDKAQWGFYGFNDDKKRFLSNQWSDNNYISVKTKELGLFGFQKDDIAPIIRPVKVNEDQIAFVLYDEGSGIKNFRCELNGKFVLMDYDYKKRMAWSIKKDENEPFEGLLKFVVTDLAGNEQVFEKDMSEVEIVKPRPKITKKPIKISKKTKTKQSKKRKR